MLNHNGKQALKFLYTQRVGCSSDIVSSLPPGRQRLLSVCVSMWLESQKISKAWALINQVPLLCFRSYGLWLTSQIIKSVQPHPQSNFLKIALAQHDFTGNFYLLWFSNCQTAETNLCNSWLNLYLSLWGCNYRPEKDNRQTKM